MSLTVSILPTPTSRDPVTYEELISFLDEALRDATLVLNPADHVVQAVAEVLPMTFRSFRREEEMLVYEGFEPEHSLLPSLLCRHLSTL